MTGIMLACLYGKHLVVDILLDNCCDSLLVDDSNSTILHYTARSGKYSTIIMQTIIGKIDLLKIQFLLTKRDIFGYMCVHDACESRGSQIEFLKILIGLGIDVNLQTTEPLLLSDNNNNSSSNNTNNSSDKKGNNNSTKNYHFTSSGNDKKKVDEKIISSFTCSKNGKESKAINNNAKFNNINEFTENFGNNNAKKISLLRIDLSCITNSPQPAQYNTIKKENIYSLTPLYICVKRKQEHLIDLLLLYQADPLIQDSKVNYERNNRDT